MLDSEIIVEVTQEKDNTESKSEYESEPKQLKVPISKHLAFEIALFWLRQSILFIIVTHPTK